MSKIYLAVPYSGTDEQRQERFEKVNKVAAKLMKEGHIVFSPISHNHPIATECGLPMGWNYWKNHDTSFIKWCDILCILTLDGWAESVGIKAEIKIAATYAKQVIYIDRGCKQWVK